MTADSAPIDPQCLGREPRDRTTRFIRLRGFGLCLGPTEVSELIFESSRGIDEHQERQTQEYKGPAGKGQPVSHSPQTGEGQRPGAGLDNGI